MIGRVGAIGRLMTTTNLLPFVGALDGLQAVRAFSTRKLYSNYTGACLRVKRSSDGAEMDIGFKLYAFRAYAYWLDEEPLLSFIYGGQTSFLSNVTGYTPTNVTMIVDASTSQLTLTENMANNLHRVSKAVTGSLVSGSQYIHSAQVRRRGPIARDLFLELHNGALATQVVFRLDEMTTQVIASSGATGVSGRIRKISENDWLCEIIFTAAAAHSSISVYPTILQKGVGDTRFYAGDNASGLILTNPALFQATTGLNGFVVSWYDQTGSGQNASQANTALQPRIVNSGVFVSNSSKVMIDLTSGGLTASTNTLSQFNSAISFAVRYARTGATIYQSIIGLVGGSPANGASRVIYTDSSYRVSWGQLASDVAGSGVLALNTNTTIVATKQSNNVVAIFVNGAAHGAGTPPINVAPNAPFIAIGPSPGLVSDAIFFDSAVSNIDRSKIESFLSS